MDLKYLEPWESISSSQIIAVSEELKRTIPKGHALDGIAVRALARRDCDDYLFQLLDGTGRVAFVHLTWKKEIDSNWPFTVIYEGLGQWQTNCMIQDHEEWKQDQREDLS